MADIVPITVALYGFVEANETIMKAAFASAEKWPTPWQLTVNIEDARVVIVDLASDDDYGIVEKLKQDFSTKVIVAFSPRKPPQTKWHLVRQPNGKVSIVGFSQLVLKLSSILKKNVEEASQPNQKTASARTKPEEITETTLTSLTETEDFDQEIDDFLPFFDNLDTLLDSKPNEKRKRFNES